MFARSRHSKSVHSHYYSNWGVLLHQWGQGKSIWVSSWMTLPQHLENVCVATAPSFCNTLWSLRDIHQIYYLFKERNLSTPVSSPGILVLLTLFDITAVTQGSWAVHLPLCHLWGPGHTSLLTPGVKAAACSSRQNPLGRRFPQRSRLWALSPRGSHQSGSLPLEPQPQVAQTQLHISVKDPYGGSWILSTDHPLRLDAPPLSVFQTPQTELPSHSFIPKTHPHRPP